MQCASVSLVCESLFGESTSGLIFWLCNIGLCEWSDFYYTVMCECHFGQCASGRVFTTSKCASASLVNVRVVLSK